MKSYFEDNPWLAGELGFRDLSEILGKGGGVGALTENETIRGLGTSSIRALMKDWTSKGDYWSGTHPGLKIEPGKRVVAPSGGAVPEKAAQPRYAAETHPAAIRDVTTGLLRIPTKREDLIESLRVMSGNQTVSPRQYFNPHTGINYPNILEGMWGGIPKTDPERIKAQADIATAGIGAGFQKDLVGQLQQAIKDLSPTDTTTSTTAPPAEVARPGGYAMSAAERAKLGTFETPEPPENEPTDYSEEILEEIAAQTNLRRYNEEERRRKKRLAEWPAYLEGF